MPATQLRDDVRGEAERLGRELPRFARQASERARAVLGDRVDRWRDRGEEYADAAGEGLETARVFVVDRVQERPLAAAAAALGVGFLLGVLLAGSRR